jgi:hypothetical protein
VTGPVAPGTVVATARVSDLPLRYLVTFLVWADDVWPGATVRNPATAPEGGDPSAWIEVVVL